MVDAAPATPSVSAAEYRSSAAPAAAPVSTLITNPTRLSAPWSLPPANTESAPMPVSVIVNTVVFTSRSPTRRMVAFRIPIARPVNTMTRYAAVEPAAAASAGAPATVADMNNKAASEPKAAAGQRCREGFIDLASRTPRRRCRSRRRARTAPGSGEVRVTEMPSGSRFSRGLHDHPFHEMVAATSGRVRP